MTRSHSRALRMFLTDILTDPELIVRVKRRVGPALWEPVAIVLQCARDALEEGLNEPDRWAPKEVAKPKKAPKKDTGMTTTTAVALKKFVADGVTCRPQKELLKREGLISCDYGLWHLTVKGLEEAVSRGFLTNPCSEVGPPTSSFERSRK